MTENITKFLPILCFGKWETWQKWYLFHLHCSLSRPFSVSQLTFSSLADLKALLNYGQHKRRGYSFIWVINRPEKDYTSQSIPIWDINIDLDTKQYSDWLDKCIIILYNQSIRDTVCMKFNICYGVSRFSWISLVTVSSIRRVFKKYHSH